MKKILYLFLLVIFLLPLGSSFVAWNGYQPINYWRFDNESGLEMVHDFGLNANPLTQSLNSCANCDNAFIIGKLLNGTSANISNTANAGGFFEPSLSENVQDIRNDSFTIAFWINVSKGYLSNSISILGKSDIQNPIGFGDSWGFRIDNINTDMNFEITNSETHNLNTSFPLNDSNWHRIVLTRDNSTNINSLKLYIDGHLNDTEDSLVRDINNVFQFRVGSVGSSNGARFWFNTSLDDIQIYRNRWNQNDVLVDYNLGFGREADKNISIINTTFNSPVIEFSSQTFTINMTYNNQTFNNINTYLNYNNTRYSSTKFGDGFNLRFSNTLSVPQVFSDKNISFFWEFVLTNSTGDTYNENTSVINQSVLNINLDDCSAFTVVLLNYTLFDEDALTYLNGSFFNTSIEIDLSLISPSDSSQGFNFNHTYTKKNSAEVCISQSLLNQSEFKLYSEVKYSSLNWVTEFHNIQNQSVINSTIPINISLFDLLITSSQEFLITVKDENLLPIPEAIIDIQRQYLGEGIFRTIEVPKTDSFGQTIGHFVLNDVVYILTVKKQGKILAVFENVRAFCVDQSTNNCRITLEIEAGTTPIKDFANFGNLSYNINYNPNTRIFQFIFSTTDGTSKTIKLNITAYDTFNNISICFNSLTASSGTVQCTLANSFGNGTALARIFSNDLFITQQIFNMGSISDLIPRDSWKYILAIILIITLPLLMYTSGTMMLMTFLVGFITAGTLALIDLGGYFGSLSAFAWFVVATIILINVVREN